MKKLLNIEIPISNRNDTAIRIFKNNIKFFEPIRDLVDFSILYNGEFITDKAMEQIGHEFNKYKINFYYREKKYTSEEQTNLLKIRQDCHAINPNPHPFSLLLDDDIEILNKEYIRDLMAGVYYMLENPKLGLLIIRKLAGYPAINSDISSITPILNTTYISTSGGLLVRNIKEWEPFQYPANEYNVRGHWTDVFITFVRLRAGYGIAQLVSESYNHYEIRNREGYDPGVRAWNWNENQKYSNNTVNLLMQVYKVPIRGTMPIELLRSMPKFKWNFKNETIDDLIFKIGDKGE